MPDCRTPHEKTQTGSRGWELLKTRDFGLLFAGQTISQIGDSLNKVALLWFVYELTGSALKMTVIGLLQTLPPLLLGPLIGVYLDRFRKKPVMITVDLLRTVMILLIPLLYLVEALTLDRVYLLVFANAVVSTVFGPALASAVPLITSKDRLVAANALMQSTANIGLLVGPAVSGIGIALIGAQNVLYVDAATFFVSALCLMPIRTQETLQPDLSGKGWTEGVASDLTRRVPVCVRRTEDRPAVDADCHAVQRRHQCVRIFAAGVRKGRARRWPDPTGVALVRTRCGHADRLLRPCVDRSGQTSLADCTSSPSRWRWAGSPSARSNFWRLL